jgi:hypothetical protein
MVAVIVNNAANFSRILGKHVVNDLVHLHLLIFAKPAG